MDAERWFYPDTSYIYGGFKKDALDFKLKRKPRKKFKGKIKDHAQEFMEKGIRFVVSELTEYEIKHSLMVEEGLTFFQANKIFQDRMSRIHIYTKIRGFKEIKISNDVLNWALEHKLELLDAFHILIATKLSLFIITKESGNRFERWSKAYDSVLSTRQFQEFISELT